MNRRSFLSLFGAGIAGIALEKAIPFGRVWSFPKEIIPAPNDILEIEYVTAERLRVLGIPNPLIVSEPIFLDELRPLWRYKPTPAFPPALRRWPS